MCCYCLQSPCPPGCPNYDPPSNGTCAACGDFLPIKSRIVNIDGKKYHYDCVNEMTFSEVLELAGIDTTDKLLELLDATVEDNPDPAEEWD